MIEQIKQFLVLESYDIAEERDGTLLVRGDDGIEKLCRAEGRVFYATVPVVPLDWIDKRKVGEVKDLLLSSDNGIATSFFKLVTEPDGTVVITLSAYCVLQGFGDDDRDDMASLLQFLSDDFNEAKKLLAPYLCKERAHAAR